MGVEEKLDISLNQNLWGLVVCYAALGIAEHWSLCVLFWLSLICSVGMTLSVLITLGFYTWRYCKNKLKG